MKQKIQKIKQHPQYNKVIHWGKLISITGSAQIIVQAVGFISGILIIRLLPVQEYAFYTLANTMLGTMTLLADGGISAGVMAQGGKVWQDKEKLGAVLATGFALRKRFAVWSLLISVPILFYLLIHNNASYLTALLITLSLIPVFFAALSDLLLEIPLKLHQNILPLQKNQVFVGLGRLLLSGLFLFIFPFSFLAILATGIPRVIGNFRLKKIASNIADEKQTPNVAVEQDILKVVKRMIIGVVYYCLSGQITVWLISIFGNTASVAQLGALGRLSMLLTSFSVLVSTLIIPRFAKLNENRAVMLSYFYKIFLGVFFFMFLIVVVVFVFSDTILLVLGNKYLGLNQELVLTMIGGCLSIIAGVLFSISTCRGWVLNPALAILINLLAVVTGVFLFNIATLMGVLYYTIFLGMAQLAVNVVYCLYKINEIK